MELNRLNPRVCFPSPDVLLHWVDGIYVHFWVIHDNIKHRETSKPLKGLNTVGDGEAASPFPDGLGEI